MSAHLHAQTFTLSSHVSQFSGEVKLVMSTCVLKPSISMWLSYHVPLNKGPDTESIKCQLPTFKKCMKSVHCHNHTGNNDAVATYLPHNSRQVRLKVILGHIAASVTLARRSLPLCQFFFIASDCQCWGLCIKRLHQYQVAFGSSVPHPGSHISQRESILLDSL